MNPLETFGEFSRKLTTTDLMLYAGVAVVLWVLFKDKLGGVSDLVKSLLANRSGPQIPVVPTLVDKSADPKKDVFFNLVASWKQTRDLAELAGCDKAVEAADQMFPHLSPVTCKEHKDEAAQLRR